MKWRILISLAWFILFSSLIVLSQSSESAEFYRVKRSGESASLPQPPIQEPLPTPLPSQAEQAQAATDFSDPASHNPTLYQWQQDRKMMSPTLPESIVDPSQFIDHRVLEEVYRKIITKQGWVDYRRLKRDRTLQDKLNAYVADLSKIDPDTLSDPRDRLAAWLNLYNAMVLKEILKHYPVRHLNQIPHFFDKAHFKIGEKKYSLLEIEENIFIETLREPRAVFARVHGAASGPKLSVKPFHPLKLEAQLEELTWKFLLDRKNVNYDPKRRILFLNPMLLWYQKELGDTFLFLKTYLDLLPESFSAAYGSYDWTLNDEKLH